MKEAFFLIAYGLLLNTGIFMTYFWGTLAFKDFQSKGWSLRRIFADPYSVLAGSLMISSVGTGLLFGTRMIDSMMRGVWTASVPGGAGYVLMTGLYLIILSKFGFMWSHSLSKRNQAFGFLVLVSSIWVMFALWYVIFDPAHVIDRVSPNAVRFMPNGQLPANLIVDTEGATHQ